VSSFRFLFDQAKGKASSIPSWALLFLLLSLVALRSNSNEPKLLVELENGNG
jgi:hypothetical protein